MKSPLAARFIRRSHSLRTRWSGVAALAGLSISVAPAILAQEPVTTYTGGGTTANFSDSANFTAPATTYGILAFGTSTTKLTVNNDLTTFSQNEILFNTASSYTLTGNSISLFDYNGTNAGKIENNNGSTTVNGLATLNTPILFAATAGPARGEINAVSGNITFGSTGTIGITGAQVAGLQLYGGAGRTVTLGGVVSGTGKYLEVNQGNTVILSAANAYTGDTYIYNGSFLLLPSTGSIATVSTIRLGGDLGSGVTNTAGSATLLLTNTTGGQTVANPLNAVGGNANTLLLSSSNTSNTNTYSGNIFLDNNMTVQSTSGGTLALTGATIDLKNQLLTVNSGGTTTFSGVLGNSTGSGSLTKTGTGMATFTGANTYTGATTISAGTLQIGSGGTTGSLSTSSTITDNGIFAVNRSNAVTQGTDFSGAAITGTGGFTQAGTGVTTLNATNTYTGTTAVNAGILRVSGGSAIADNGAVTVAIGSVFDVNGSNETVGSITGAGSISLTNGSLTTGGDGVGAGSLTGLVFGNGALSKNGSGTLTLATLQVSGSTNTANAGSLFSGGLNMASGSTVNISAYNSSGTGLITSSGTLAISKPQMLLTGGITVNAGTTTLSDVNTAGTGGTLTLNTGGTLTITNANAAQLASVVFNGTGTFTTPAQAVIFGSLAGTQGFTQGAFALTLGTNNTNGTYTGAIAGAVGSNLTKTGSGTQALNGTDATTGTITANGSGGTLAIGGQFAGNGAVAANAGTLQLNFNAATAPATNLLNPASTLTLGGGTLAVQGKDNAPSSQAFASTTLVTGSASTVSVTTGASSGTAALNLGAIVFPNTSGNVNNNFGTALNFVLPAPAGTPTTANSIQTSTGAASSLLRSGNNQAFATVGGTDYAAKDATNAFIVGASTISGFYTPATSTSIGSGTGVNTDITGVSPSVSTGVTVNTLRFSDTAARTLTIASGQTVSLNSGGILVSSNVASAGTRISGGTLTSGATSSEILVHQFSTQPFTIDSVIANAVVLTKTGPGTLILTQANTTSGATYVDSGVLQIGAGGSLASSTVNTSPNDPTAVFDVNNQTTSVNGVNGGGATGGYVTLGTRGVLNIVGGGGTYNGTLVGGPDSVVNKTANGTQGFQTSNLAFLGTINVSGTGSGLGVFNSNGANFSNATVNLTSPGFITTGGGFLTALNIGNLIGSGPIDGGTANGSNFTVGVGFRGADGTYSGAIKNGVGNGATPNPNIVSFAKFGSGTTTLSGTNTYTGNTQLNTGGVVFDYSGGKVPLPTASTLFVGGATATFQGAATGTTAIATGTFGVNNAALSQVAVTGTGTTLTLKTTTVNSIPTLGSTTQNNVLLFNNSASTNNAIVTDAIIGAADSTAAGTIGIRTQNGLLVTGAGASTATFNNYRADVLIRDTTSIGFATNTANGTGTGANTTTISRYTGAVGFPTGATLDTTNYVLTASTQTQTAQLLYNTLQLDSSSNSVTLTANNSNFGNSSASVSGRGVLATGTNGATINSTLGTNQPTYFYNYQTGTAATGGQTLTLNMPLAGTTFFNGTGLTVVTGNVNSQDQYFQSGVTRLTGAQNSGDALTAGNGVYRLNGGILEIGADLTGSTSFTSGADFSRTVGAAAGQVQLLGDTGFSAFGGTRTVNLGGAGQTLVWGNDNFLASTPTAGTTEGNNTFRLSSAFSDSTVVFQNGIALGSITRNVDVANGSAATDARLSGVISGVFAPTATLANGAPAVVNAAAGLNKLGLGTLELTANNTYRGQTTVSAGTLLVNNTPVAGVGSGTGTGAVVVNNAGSILGGTGTISGPVTVNALAAITGGTAGSGNTIVAGNVGTLNTGALTLASTAIFSADIANAMSGFYDVLNVTGTVSLSGATLALNIPASLGLTAGLSLTLINNDGTDTIVGNFANLAQGDTVTANGNQFTVSYIGGDGNDFTITAVPEPGTVAAGLLALGSLGLSQRRRVRRWLGAARLAKAA